MSTTPSPQRPLYAWLAAGGVAALIASSVLVSVALAAPHVSAPREAGGAIAPTAAEAALNILPRPRAAQAESSGSCGRIRLGFNMRCLAWGEF